MTANEIRQQFYTVSITYTNECDELKIFHLTDYCTTNEQRNKLITDATQFMIDDDFEIHNISIAIATDSAVKQYLDEIIRYECDENSCVYDCMQILVKLLLN